MNVHFLPGNIIEVTNRAGAYIVGPLFGLFALGILSKRATGFGATVGSLLGVAAGILATHCGSFGLTEKNVSFQFLAPLSFGVSYVCGWLLSLLSPRPSAHHIEGLVYCRKTKLTRHND